MSSSIAKVHHDVFCPAHYTQGKIECIDALESMLTDDEFIGFLKGNVVKYLWRARHKGSPTKDLQKAQWYLERLNKCLGSKNCLTAAERLNEIARLHERVEAAKQEAAGTKPEQGEQVRKDQECAKKLQKEAQAILSKRRLTAWFPLWKSV